MLIDEVVMASLTGHSSLVPGQFISSPRASGDALFARQALSSAAVPRRRLSLRLPKIIRTQQDPKRITSLSHLAPIILPPPVLLSIHPSIHPFIQQSIQPCIHACMHASIHPSKHQCINPFIHPFIHLHSSIYADPIHSTVFI